VLVCIGGDLDELETALLAARARVVSRLRPQPALIKRP
jgi:hypothetical protein